MGSNTRSNTYLNKISKYATGLSIISIVAIFFVGLVLPKGLNWFFVIGFMICFVVSIGWLRTGRLSGIFINERNLMSLSRFQLVLWTIIVLSAFLTIALIRISASMADPTAIPDPLAIALPEQLWTLLGISTASLVGSPLILSTKAQKKPTSQQQEAFFAGKVAKFDEENAKTIAANLMDTKGRKLSDKIFENAIIKNTTMPPEKNSLDKKRNDLNVELITLGATKDDLTKRLQTLAATKTTLTKSLQTFAKSKDKKEIDQVKTELEKNNNETLSIGSELSNTNEEIDAKNSELKEAQAQLLVLGKRTKTIVNEVKKLKNNAESSGILNVNADIKDASFSDMFQGDEEGNCNHIDMAKVQMFFFTLIIAFSYMVLLVNLILNSDATELGNFPKLSDGLVALLGISTAGYLGNKTGDKTKTVPKP